MWVCLRIPKTAEFLADSRFGWNFRGAKVTGYCAGIKGNHARSAWFRGTGAGALLGRGGAALGNVHCVDFWERAASALLGRGKAASGNGLRPSGFRKLLAFPSRERSSRPRSGRRPRSPSGQRPRPSSWTKSSVPPIPSSWPLEGRSPFPAAANGGVPKASTASAPSSVAKRNVPPAPAGSLCHPHFPPTPTTRAEPVIGLRGETAGAAYIEEIVI